ncbi:MAG: hypothetical protein K2X86_14510 [Cytophagaceae bacterium]|nr:hypothetical protein [Cytophagaceae bacterium]
MKNFLMILTIFLVVSSYAQNNIKLTPSEIDSLGVDFVINDQVVDKNNLEMELNQRFKIQIIAYKKDGSVMRTPIKGKEGLAKNQFDIEIKGGTEETIYGASTGKFVTSNTYMNMPFVDGFACIQMIVSHKDSPDKKYTCFVKMKRPASNEYYFGINSASPYDLELDVSYIKGSAYPLSIKIKCSSFPELNKTININPEVESITFSTEGRNGEEAGITSGSVQKPYAPKPGGDGGNITITFRGEKASSYEEKIILKVFGGRGGLGGYGFPSASDGRDGQIRVIKK